MRIRTTLAATVALAAVLTACGADEPGTAEGDAPEPAVAADEEGTADPEEPATEDIVDEADQAGTSYPLTVPACGVEFTYDAPPERVVATDTSALETLIDLGLGDRIVGWFGSPDIVAPQRAEEIEALEYLGESFPYPSLEAVLAVDPDFVFTFGLSEETGLTAERFADEGIAMYSFVQVEGCPSPDDPMTLEVFYDQVAELGDIFDMRAETEDLIASWRDEVEAVRADVGPDAEVTVFLNGSFNVEEPFSFGARTLVHDVIESAGGTNIFGDVDDASFNPTWEDVVARDPQLIAVNSDLIEPFDAFAGSNPALQDMPAVTNDNYVAFDYIKRVPGPQIIDGVSDLAAAIAATDD